MFRSILNKLHIPKWLFFVLLIVLFLRIPNLFEPYYYGDEMIYIVLGQALRKGLTFYSQIHDNKPPLLYLLAALSGNLFWFKSILLIWSLVTIFIFWKFVRFLFSDNNSIEKVSVFIFSLLTTIPFLEGNIVNSEILMLAPTIIGFYLGVKVNKTPKILFLSGIAFSIAALFKIPAAFDLPALIVFWMITTKWSVKSIKKLAVDILILSLGFIFPIILTFVWYFWEGALKEYVTAAYLQNIGYLSSWRPVEQRESFLVRNLPLLQRMGVLLFSVFILFLKRFRLSKNFILITSWVLFSSFAVTLSERPYPHYLVQLIPSLTLLLGLLFTAKTKEQLFAIFPLTLVLFIPVHFDYWYYKSYPYYERFISFSSQVIPKNDYISSFGQNVSSNYEIAKYLIESTNSSDRIFIWGDSSAIYALSNRLPPIKYAADYHIKDFSTPDEVIDTLKKSPPQVIIIDSKAEKFDPLNEFTKRYYFYIKTIDNRKIYLIRKPGSK